jgi:hypothetical protein
MPHGVPGSQYNLLVYDFKKSMIANSSIGGQQHCVSRELSHSAAASGSIAKLEQDQQKRTRPAAHKAMDHGLSHTRHLQALQAAQIRGMR